jgi:predicted ribosome quality control (RQC) complex YloA/Tae2 family protein
MDGLTLRAVAMLAGKRFDGRKITRVRWAAPGGLMLGFSGHLPALVLSIHPALYGLFAPEGKDLDTSPVPAQSEVIARRTKGARLAGVEMSGLERVVRLRLERRSPSGRVEVHQLVFEAMSRWSNIVLVREEDGKITDAVKMVAGREGRRSVLPGQPYEPPPPDKKADPAEMSVDELTALLEENAPGGGEAKDLFPLLSGLSPKTSSDILQRCEEAGGASPEAVARFLNEVISRPPEVGAIIGNGRARLVLAGVGAEAGQGVEDLLEASGRHYVQEAGRLILDRERGVLGRAVKKREGQVRSLLAGLEADMRETERADDYREWGTLLVSHIPEIKRGDASFVTATPYGQPGEEIEVPLDPKLTPHQNAEALFKRSRKLRVRSTRIAKKLETVSGELGAIGKLREEIALAADAATLADLKTRAAGFLKVVRRVRDKESEGAGEPRVRPPRPYLEYVSTDGFSIIVGKSSSSNEHVYRNVASPGDLWCHADGYAGAHVVLKSIGARSEPPEQGVSEACMLAAYHSRGRDQAVVPVSYTRRKYVHKPRGSTAGMVVMLRRKTMMVRPLIPPGVRLKERLSR